MRLSFSFLQQQGRRVVSPLLSLRRHPNLLKGFVTRDIRGRFAGSMAGILWTLITPLATMSIYIFVFSYIMRVQVTASETGTNSFIIYFLSGLLPWLLFTESLMRAVGSLVDNAGLITKVMFPVELLPASSVLSAILINGIGLTSFLLYLLATGHGNSFWLSLLLVLPAQLLFTWGLAQFLAALCVFIRDIREFLGLFLMLWFFATPIIYPVSMVPPEFRSLMLYNPMALFVSLYRDALLLQQVNVVGLLLAVILSLFTYTLGAWFFMRAKPAFGDVL